MAKISRKIIVDDTPSSTVNSNIESISTVEKSNVENASTKMMVEKPHDDYVEDIVFDNSNTEIAARLLIENLGSTLFNNLRNNKLLRLPYSDSNREINKWLEDLLNTYIRFEDISLIIESLSSLELNKKQTQEIKVKNLEKETKNEEIIESLKAELSELKTYKSRQEKKIAASISLRALSDSVPDTLEFKTIKNLLKEASEEPIKGTDEFIINFISGMSGFLFVAGKSYPSDHEKIESISESLRNLLAKLKGLYVSQRRPLLDEIAKIAGNFNENYIFISPEETLQIDPAIHNAKGIGGSRVKEGVSFAVVEKNTRKTIIYADITV